MSEISALNLEPGDAVGGYTLISRLGSGAMGSVWRVQDDGGHTYAMKILRDSLSDEENAHNDPNLKENVPARERLRREALALRRIHNPGVCGIVDMELDDAVAFIVTELIEGKNLKEDVAANGPYVGNDLERLARKLIEAVRAVHKAGIIHRDIKPTNVMISATGPVLVDFGIAMGENESHVTRTGLVMGTPGFIAPEIIDGADSNEATDWWSTASVLAFAATGSPVFGTKPMMAVLERAASGNANLAGLPANTLAAFRSALHPDPSRRCTPEQLLHAVALDALNPFAWHTPESSGLFDSTKGADASEVVRPFDVPLPEGMRMPPQQSVTTNAVPRRSAALNRLAQRNQPGNLRADWDGVGTDADNDPGFVAATMALSPEQCTVALPSDALGPEQATQVFARTRVMPTESPAEAKTSVMPAAGYPAAPGVATSATTVMPGAYGQRQTAAPTQVMRPMQSLPPLPSVPPLPSAQPMQSMPSMQPAQPMSSAPMPPLAQEQIQEQMPAQPLQPEANPADVKRGRYLSRSTLPLVLIGLVPAVTALFNLLIAPAAALLLFWLLFTIGFSTEAQLEREGKRGGRRKGSDTAIGVLSLPWHVVQGAFHGVIRVALYTLVYALLTVIATLVLSLPWQMVPIGDIWPYMFPYLTDNGVPLSSTGLAVTCTAAAAWLITAFWPNAPMLRLGAGMIGRRRTPRRASRTASSPERQSI
ncbi:serine/threonine-protein kinase [Bifidobacterium pongonis]|uniref:serine/threonine-protein kinase n=1 Tax=Bifidobacterium pongonis TaxID=2834432 RepID=UPI001F2E27EC|nr:serine/threonine-protein kinase [Bifidobacterium pongonis]